VAEVLDYSSGWPTPAAIKAARYVGVVRYIGTPGRGKNLTRVEYAQMKAAGIPVALVYEDTAGWMQGGARAGAAAARAVEDDAESCGMDDLPCCYLASDQDVVTKGQMGAVMDCLDGASTVWGLGVTGIYGELDVVDAALDPKGRHATWGWQTVAWSHGVVSQRAHLYQHAGYVYPGGVQCDRSTVLRANWGQVPRPGGAPSKEEDVPLTSDDITKVADEVTKSLIPALIASLPFRLALREQFIIALSDPGHQYLQDDISKAEKPISDQVARVQDLATSIQASEGSLMAKMNAMSVGGVDPAAVADRVLDGLAQRIASGAPRA
jgi:hypothetical protein